MIMTHLHYIVPWSGDGESTGDSFYMSSYHCRGAGVASLLKSQLKLAVSLQWCWNISKKHHNIFSPQINYGKERDLNFPQGKYIEYESMFCVYGHHFCILCNNSSHSVNAWWGIMLWTYRTLSAACNVGTLAPLTPQSVPRRYWLLVLSLVNIITICIHNHFQIIYFQFCLSFTSVAHFSLQLCTSAYQVLQHGAWCTIMLNPVHYIGNCYLNNLKVFQTYCQKWNPIGKYIWCNFQILELTLKLLEIWNIHFWWDPTLKQSLIVPNV